MRTKRGLTTVAVAILLAIGIVLFVVERDPGSPPPLPVRGGDATPSLPARASGPRAAPVDEIERITVLTPPPAAPTSVPGPDAPLVLSDLGRRRALLAVLQNPDTRGVLARLRPLDLSLAQRDRVLAILGARSRQPTLESQLRAALPARPLSPREQQRLLDERKRREESLLDSMRPAFAAVLTPAQLSQAGLASPSPR